MITVHDIFYHIAQRVRDYTGSDEAAAIDEFIAGTVFDYRIAITTDLEATELNYLTRFGHGSTFYFKIKDYEHGRQLASDIFYALKGVVPDMDAHTGSAFDGCEQLYLFLHLTNISPAPPDTK